MELTIIQDDKSQLIFEIPGADHTFCNHLKKELYSDPAIKEATYTISNPLVGIPRFLVHTNGKKAPKATLKDAVKRIAEQNKEFLTSFKKLK